MVEVTSGDLFEADVDAITNPVNCVGVMGKGLALAFKKRFPDNFAAYRDACDNGECAIGRVFVFDPGEDHSPRFIVNFPTKDDWRNPSAIDFIHQGLASLIGEIDRLKIKSVALPALGCGLGGLEWGEVQAAVMTAFAARDDVKVLLFKPG